MLQQEANCAMTVISKNDDQERVSVQKCSAEGWIIVKKTNGDLQNSKAITRCWSGSRGWRPFSTIQAVGS